MTTSGTEIHLIIGGLREQLDKVLVKKREQLARAWNYIPKEYAE